MNFNFFNFLVKECKIDLHVYDCSMISDFKIFKNLETLELHFCGQLTEENLNKILENCNILKKLVITGAYIIEDFELPKNIKYLDLSHCSRLSDSFIERINKTYKKLDVLKLSFCYGFKDAKIEIEIDKLFVCETFLYAKSLLSIKNFYSIKKLSLKKCVNIFSIHDKVVKFDDLENVLMKNDQSLDENNIIYFEKFENLEYLDIEGISTIKKLDLCNKIKFLNIASCFDFDLKSIENLIDLNYLNVSKINNVDVEIIKKFKKLKILNVSWSSKITDEVLLEIINELKFLQKIYVFGCFNLSKKIGKLAWDLKNNLKIIGNPSETQFLMEN
ncbi:hypothetical protein GVAV_003048 [Gurleya vavrai]